VEGRGLPWALSTRGSVSFCEQSGVKGPLSFLLRTGPRRNLGQVSIWIELTSDIGIEIRWSRIT